MNRRSKPYQRLECWRLAFEFVPLAYVGRQFPAQERFELTSQLRRAATSIPLNIAEGAGRRTPKEFCQFLIIARGSINEVHTILLLAERLSYLTDVQTDEALLQLDHISALLQGLLNSLNKPAVDTESAPAS